MKWYKLLITGLVIIMAVIIYLFANISISEEHNVVHVDLTLKYDARSEVLVTTIPMVSTEVKNDSQSKFNHYELELLYMIVWAESGSQSVKGQMAVASVILNRLESKYFPNDLEKVIYQGNGRQFNGVWRNEFGFYTDDTIKAVNQAIKNPMFDKDVVYFANVDLSSNNSFIEDVILKNEVATIGDHTFSYDERIK